MGLECLILALLVICIFQCNGEVHSAISTIGDESIEIQLQKINQSPIKTVKTREGDTIDCINIYKQPSLDHPLLRGHKIQMRPESLPKRLNDETLHRQKITYQISSPEAANCPKGTVPIRRTQKDDLIRAKTFTESYASNAHPLTGITPGRHQAIVRSIPNPNILYRGIEAIISVYNPVVQAGQSSSAQMWIESGEPNVRNSLQTGWMVAPNLYGDNHTRTFIYYSVSGKNPVGCFNHLCPGFVQVDNNFTLGGTLNVSEYNADRQNIIHSSIFQDHKTGNWWLRHPNSDALIGYWPSVLLPQLERGASQVIWGGQAFGHSNGASPGMGNGLIPQNNFRRACYMMHIKIVDTNNQIIDPNRKVYKTETYVDNNNCYNIEGFGYNGKSLLYSFLFGGPGGDNCGI